MTTDTANSTPPPPRRLAIRDEAKPFILIAAVAAGVGINRMVDGELEDYHWVVQAGLFLVIFSIMAFVEITGVGHAFRKLKPTALAITTNYLVVPLFAWSLGWLLLSDHPDLWAGVILYTLTPCIGWYLIFIDLAKGNMDWGLAMLPIDIVLQLVLLPVYLWLLIGNVVPVDLMVLVRSVAVFLALPFAAAHLTRTLLVRWKGRTFTHGPYKHAIGELKLWALVAVVIGIFATQPALDNTDLGGVGLIIATITLFFLGVFGLALAIGRTFKLGYADTTTMVFEVAARNSESVIGVAAVAFAGRPLVTLAILIGPIVELPALLALSRTMLRLRTRWHWPDATHGRNRPYATPT
jgi:arsenite transporter